MNNTQLLRRAAYFFNHSQVLCNIKQFYLVAMAILPEGGHLAKKSVSKTLLSIIYRLTIEEKRTDF